MNLRAFSDLRHRSWIAVPMYLLAAYGALQIILQIGGVFMKPWGDPSILLEHLAAKRFGPGSPAPWTRAKREWGILNADGQLEYAIHYYENDRFKVTVYFGRPPSYKAFEAFAVNVIDIQLRKNDWPFCDTNRLIACIDLAIKQAGTGN